MTIQQLRRLHQAQPFRPFDICLADGRALSVAHPELLAINPPGRTISVGMSDGSFEVVDLFLVLSLKRHANGTTRRSRRNGR